ncbi:MAG: hypothetical protein CMA11_06360 [Euryarchaeota archaeon]|nr:hypothetical protein [Euryarchaeota archaeon]
MLIALGLLGAHIATLRLLTTCKRELDSRLTDHSQRAELSAQSLEEIVRIGADVADTLDGLSVGLTSPESAATATFSQPQSIQDTIIALMVDKFLGNEHGSTTQQERPIHEDNPQTQNDNFQQHAETTQE